ncbi:MAG TPA: hypothetical protein PLD20_34970 [Blastocatellia bacterium]|nr:hypothetical protein [Blastocatellia bacterium]HNG33940.1 hypothetical protein [Blastocatellia bacterium]
MTCAFFFTSTDFDCLSGLEALVISGFLRGLPTGFFSVTGLVEVLAGLAVAVFPFTVTPAVDLVAELALDFGTVRNFACAVVSAILVFVVFDVVFTIALGRFESVSLIRFPFRLRVLKLLGTPLLSLSDWFITDYADSCQTPEPFAET